MFLLGWNSDCVVLKKLWMTNLFSCAVLISYTNDTQITTAFF